MEQIDYNDDVSTVTVSKHATFFREEPRVSCIVVVNFLIRVKMIEQQRQRVEQEMNKLVDDVDKSFLRKMQVNTPDLLHHDCPTHG